MNLLNRKHLRPTLICLTGAIFALFLAQIPNDTRSKWFRSLIRPEILPRSIESKIGFVWTTIFMLAGVGTASATPWLICKNHARTIAQSTALTECNKVAYLCESRCALRMRLRHTRWDHELLPVSLHVGRRSFPPSP